MIHVLSACAILIMRHNAISCGDVMATWSADDASALVIIAGMTGRLSAGQCSGQTAVRRPASSLLSGKEGTGT